jgi:hypothetical protein
MRVTQRRYNLVHERRLRQLKEHGVMLQVRQGRGAPASFVCEVEFSLCF